jgi:hypothetical protein
MPAVPGTDLAMIKAEIIFGALEAFLDGPTQPSGTGEFGKRCACWQEDEGAGVLIGSLMIAPDQKPSRPACSASSQPVLRSIPDNTPSRKADAV